MRENAGDEAVMRTYEEKSGRNERLIEVILLEGRSNDAGAIHNHEVLSPDNSVNILCQYLKIPCLLGSD